MTARRRRSKRSIELGPRPKAIVGDGGKRDRAAVGARHAQVLIAAACRLARSPRPARGSAPGGRPRCTSRDSASMSPMVATRIVSAISLGATPRRAAASNFGVDAQLRPVDGGGGGNVVEARHAAQRALELPDGKGQRVAVVGKHREGELALAALVHVPGASIGHVGELVGDDRLQALLRQRALGLGREMHEQRRLADLQATRRCGAAENEHAAYLGDRLQDIHHAIGRGARALQRRAGRQLDGDDDARSVLVGQEAGRQQRRGVDRPGEQAEPGKERQVAHLQRPAQEGEVAAHDEAAALVLLGDRPQEVGGHHRRDEARDEQREQHGDGDGQAELLEVLPRDAAHERDRREDRDDRQRDGDDGEADLVGGLERGAIGRLARAHVAHDVLDLDDGVVDEDADDERDAEQAHEVQREAEQRHGPEGRDGRQRQGDRGDERRAHSCAGTGARRARRAPRPRSASRGPRCSCRAYMRRRRRSSSGGRPDRASAAPRASC